MGRLKASLHLFISSFKRKSDCFKSSSVVKSDKEVMTVKRTICTLLSFVLLFTLFPFTYAVAESLSFEDDPKAIQTASNSVIMLSCYDKEGNLYATGSAFAAFEEGVFVTNCHVIEKEVYAIRAQKETGLEFSINSVVAYDVDKDIAILRTEAKTGLYPLPIGSTAALERGEKVIAIGSPLGLINTLSIGLYSGTIKDDRVYLQFSAAISHGSSGGALFNNRGEVVGITTASFTEGQNLNLAIPIEEAVELWEKRENAEELSVADFHETWERKADDAPISEQQDEDEVPYYGIDYILSPKSDFVMTKIRTSGYVVPATYSSEVFWLVSTSVDIDKAEKAIIKEMDNPIGYEGKRTPKLVIQIDRIVDGMDKSILSYGKLITIQATVTGDTLYDVSIIQS